MSISATISRLVTQRRGLVWLSVALLAAGSILVLITRMKLDTEVLNLLPRGFESVEGLKVYNRDFSQVRALTFALVCKPDDADRLEEFAPQFAESLRQQPWCARVLAGTPMETPDGIRDLQSIAVPLLLNLEPDAFAETVSLLQPAKISERLHRLHEEIEAGSPKPQMELTLDPLGVIAPALKPFASNATMEEDQPLTSADRTMRVFLIVTNQPDIGAFACQRLMRDVNAFRAKAREGWDGGPLEILVTGRSAYVAEISLSMRHDVIVTLLGSIFLVGGVFWLGFRRWVPLIGMGFSLLLCCLVALAAGLLIFGELNMVTVGFCAILIGLGVDFAILVFGRYQQARDDGCDHPGAVTEAVKNLGRAVFFGALTTAVGFLALLLSGSAGFTQLGVLIAIGIFLAGLFTMTVFFLFLRNATHNVRADWIFTLVKNYVRWTVRRPAIMLWIATPILLILTAIAFSPRPRLIFDASTQSLEPRRSAAGYALHTIMQKMPTRWEPALGIVRASNAQELHDAWQKVAAHWSELQAAGKIKSFSTPAALALSPQRAEVNREKLRTVDFVAAKQALENAITQEGFSEETFAAGFYSARRSGTRRTRERRRARLAKTSAEHFELVVPGRSLLRAGSSAHDRIRDHQRTDHVAGTEGNVAARTAGRRCADGSFRLELYAHRFDSVVAAPAHFHQHAHGDFRCHVARVSLSRLATVVDPDRNADVCGRAMIASMKLLQIPLNLLNVLAFRLVLAIGVDYGIYVLLVWQRARQLEHDVAGVVKPVILAGLTAIAGFGSLGLANNPTLAGLGIACAIGIFWSLAATVFFTLPATAAAEPKTWREESVESHVVQIEHV